MVGMTDVSRELKNLSAEVLWPSYVKQAEKELGSTRYSDEAMEGARLQIETKIKDETGISVNVRVLPLQLTDVIREQQGGQIDFTTDIPLRLSIITETDRESSTIEECLKTTPYKAE